MLFQAARKVLSPLAIAIFFILFGSGCGKDLVPSEFGPETPSYRAQVINPDYVGGFRDPRSGALFFWGSDGAIVRSDDGETWQPTQTGTTQKINRIANDEKSGTLVAVGEAGTVLRSQDAGKTWSPIDAAIPDVELRTVVHHGPTGRWLAGGSKGTIITSNDGGVTWTKLNSNVAITIEALFVEAEKGAVFLGGQQGLIGASRDGGQQWTLSQIKMDTPITHFYAYGDVIVATSARGRVLSSTDSGDNWNIRRAESTSFWTDSAQDPKSKAIVLTGHTGDILRTEDGGNSWQRISFQPAGQGKYLGAVRYDEDTQSLIALGHFGAAFRSSDGGKTWVSVEGYDGNEPLEVLLYEPKSKRLVAAGSKGSIRISESGWKNSRAIVAYNDAYLREVVVSADGTSFVAGGGVGSLARSSNDGRTWLPVDGKYPNPSTPPTFRAMTVEPFSDGIVAAGPTGMILRSADNGESWKTAHHTPFEQNEAFTQVLVGEKDKSIVVIEAYGRMYVSLDAGKTWKQNRISAPGELWHGAVLSSKRLMIATGSKGVLALSTDSGMAWQVVNSGTDKDLYGAYADERSGSLFVLGDGGTIQRSMDGRSWESLKSGTTAVLRRMASDPKTGALIAFGQNGAIVRSSDGRNWQAVKSGVSGELRTALIEPGSRNLVLLGQHGAIIRSADGGQTWEKLSSHTRASFRSGVFHPATGTLVAVGERIVRLERTAASP